MLNLIGAGLGSLDDLTLKGEKILKQCDIIYLDVYTSIMTDCVSVLEKLTGKQVKLADRELLEESEEIFSNAMKHDVALVVIGDPLSATTHTDIILRAVERGIQYKVVHNTSIMTAVGCCGLQLYNYGVTVSIPFWDEFGSPESFYEKILWNFSHGLHTLCLLDIKIKERSLENILRDRKIYEPARFMTCGQAAFQLMELIKSKKGKLEPKLSSDCLIIGLARVGSVDQIIAVSNLREMSRGHPKASDPASLTPISRALGGPLHSLVIPGKLHPSEEEFLRTESQLPSGNAPNLPRIFLPPDTISDDEHSRIDKLFSAHKQLVEAATVSHAT